MKYENRVGIGFDVHRLSNVNNSIDNHITLCGVNVPHDRALIGHSDADVMLHAIVDALLGAMGAGDIGQHFPPSDNKYKGMNSRIFVEYCVNLLSEIGGRVTNIDTTLIGEKPKIGTYREQMRASVADMLKIDISRINIKATTTERIGFTGREEGLAAQAIANIEIKV